MELKSDACWKKKIRDNLIPRNFLLPTPPLFPLEWRDKEPGKRLDQRVIWTPRVAKSLSSRRRSGSGATDVNQGFVCS